jgi:O-acetyl-ADP-ribose deacetylase (regulator of RNase III)
VLHEVTGDILLSKASVLVHGVSPKDSFNQGLALSIREMWPALYKDFRHYCSTYHPKPGTLWTWGGTDETRIINLFTQDASEGRDAHAGKATLPNLNHCFKELKKEVKAQGFKSVAITKIATGVGGLKWEEVKPLMWESLADIGVPVYVYSTFKKGEAAKEAK